jgi:hypothetical protein
VFPIEGAEMGKARRLAVVLLAGSALSVSVAAASGEPPKGKGYLKDVQGGGAGQSECAPPHQDQLPPGQAKKC